MGGQLQLLLLLSVLLAPGRVSGGTSQDGGGSASRLLLLQPPLYNSTIAYVASSQQLFQAAANSNVTTFIFTGDVALGGEVTIVRQGNVTVTLTSAPAAAGVGCAGGNPACPLLDGRGASRLLSVTARQVRLSGLRLANGLAAAGDGGCLHVSGTAELSNLLFTGCAAAGGSGGSVFVAGPANVTGVAVRNSSATGGYGGAFAAQALGVFADVNITGAAASLVCSLYHELTITQYSAHAPALNIA